MSFNHRNWKLLKWQLLAGFFCFGIENYAQAQDEGLNRYSFSHAQMGTVFRIVLYDSDSIEAGRAAKAAFGRIDELNTIFSDYLPESELSRLEATAGIGEKTGVSEDLWAVLLRAEEVNRSSKGAFDITIGPLSRLWRRAFRMQEFPEMDKILEARSKVGYKKLKLLAGSQSVVLKSKGMQLDAGGIAKGYAVDGAMKVLNRHGFHQALIDGGGDILAGNPPPGEAGWKVSIEGAEELAGRLIIANGAVATSGSSARFLEWEGTRYSHLIDPRTGLGVTHPFQVTVEAPDCTTADALASAASILGPQKSKRLERKFKNCRFTFMEILNPIK
jgi:FAD:protein FMN transferase